MAAGKQVRGKAEQERHRVKFRLGEAANESRRGSRHEGGFAGSGVNSLRVLQAQTSKPHWGAGQAPVF